MWLSRVSIRHTTGSYESVRDGEEERDADGKRVAEPGLNQGEYKVTGLGLSLAEQVTLEECTDEEDMRFEKRDNIQDLEDRIKRRRTAGDRGKKIVGSRGEKMRQAKFLIM